LTNENERRKISGNTERLAGRHLFLPPNDSLNDNVNNKPDKVLAKKKDESNFMDFRTNINTREVMKCVLYYGGLAINYESDTAREMKDFWERLLSSYKGLSREQATDVLRQQFPKTREVETGGDKMNEDHD